MPKSKRNKVVTLSKTKKKPKDQKDHYIEEVRKASELFKHIYLLSMENQRNAFLKEVRAHFREGDKEGMVFCGKNKLMQLALGTRPENECQDNIHLLASQISGFSALLFTDEDLPEVQQYFADYRPKDFARCGAVATEKVVLAKGTDALAHMPHSIESHLRSLGLPTKLSEGKIHLLGKHVVCEEGATLTSDQAQVLKLLEKPLAEFKITIESMWTRGGKFQDFDNMED